MTRTATSARAEILLVEDRASLRRMMERALTQEGYAVTAAADGPEGMRLVAERGFDLVLTDLQLPGASGLEVVAASRRAQPRTPVAVLTAYGTVQSAVEAMKRGAVDFLEKPLEIDDLYALVRSLVGTGEDQPEVLEIPGGPAIVGRHPALRAALGLARKVAPTASTVLLAGETGTGKELFARAVHAWSRRAGGPFVAVNCAAIPESLIENELFGHERGAYTGAGQRQQGRFELAQGGTIFLDEIGELDPGVQGKILRVLEERVIERVGGGRPLAVDVRVVAATNRRLREMVDEGTFREDLYFRLDVFPIELPPLRERRSDVAALARHLLRRLGERSGLAPPELAADAVALLEEQEWPGNVRQLANLVERALVLHEGPTLRAADLEPLLGGIAAAPGERDRIRDALVATGGDRRRAAERLGMSVRTLQRKIRRYELQGVPAYRQ